MPRAKKQPPPAPTPPVSKPVGSLLLVDVRGFPDGHFAELDRAGVRTLADLEARAGRQPGAHGVEGRVYAAFRSVPGFDLEGAKAAAAAVMTHLRPPAPKFPAPEPEPVPAAPPPAPAEPAEEFTEDTPPPRTRPHGDPLPRFVTLPPGEDPAALFPVWDRAGRVPAGSVLTEFVGTFDAPGGYVDMAGNPVRPSESDGRRVEVVVRCQPDQRKPSRLFAVLDPEGK